MALSKLEIQQMLREMNVKFHADETYDELKQRLQREHHSLWLKSVSDGRRALSGTGKQLIRKRKKAPSPPESTVDPSILPADPPKPTHAERRSDMDRSRRPEATFRPRPIEKPDPGKPWKAAAAGTEAFNRKKHVFASVLKRANLCCERCSKPSDTASGTADLQPFYIEPLVRGGEHSIKNVVALCPTCLATMQNDPSPKEIKELKRRTRSKLYDSPEVVQRKDRHRPKGRARKRE